MALPPGRYVARLYGWEVEMASARRRARVDIVGDHAARESVIFGLNGGALVRVRSHANVRPHEAAADRAMQALTMVVQDRVRDALSHGESLPPEIEISEDEIVTATQYVEVDQDLDISFAPDTVLSEHTVS